MSQEKPSPPDDHEVDHAADGAAGKSSQAPVDDVFGPDRVEEPEEQDAEESKEERKRSVVPRTSFVRSARMAALPLGHAGRAAMGVGKRLGGRPAEAVTAELQQRTAEQVFRVLGELKGGAMKMGQAMSVLEAALPEEMAEPYRATLTRLQDAAPPMPAEVVHEVMAEQIGDDWRDRFSEFDDHPAASASIGQVHRGTSRDGREVAVKVQYPGAAKALTNDLNQMMRMGRMFGSWLPGVDIKALLDEIRERVSEELDYLRESQSQRMFAAAFEGDPDFAIPHVLFAAPRVLVTEWQEGQALSQIIAGGTQEERDAAGLLYQRFVLSSPARAGLLQADPHPGNYRITPDGRMGVVDFGAVAHLPDGYPRAMGRLIRVANSGDAESFREGLREEGFLRPHISLDAERVLDFLAPFVEPVRHERFNYSREWMRSLFDRVRDPRNPEFAVGLKLNLPPQYLLIHRVLVGTTAVTCQLEATVAVRAEMERWMPGFVEG